MNHKRIKLLGSILSALIFTIFIFGAITALAEPNAQAPTIISYQGFLTGSDGNPMDGTVNLQFELYTAETGGSALWSETQNNVSVSNGYFSVMLGSVTPISASDFNGSERWLQVTVDGTAMPRQQFASVPYALQAANAWALDGNSGTTDSTVLGTTDSQTLTVVVNNATVMRFVPSVDDIFGIVIPNIVGGYYANHTTDGVFGAVIAGGGGDSLGLPLANVITGSYGTISGGFNNTAGQLATIGGGGSNTAGDSYATIAGGERNTASGRNTVIGGGTNNVANGIYSAIVGGTYNETNDNRAFIGGGGNNVTYGQYATITGGDSNIANANYAFTGGGQHNSITGGQNSTIAGGGYNEITADHSTISGGQRNHANGTYGFIGGGRDHTINASFSTIGGGDSNAITSTYAFIGGGFNNNVSGYVANISGGINNTVTGSSGTIGGGSGNNASDTYTTISGGANNTAPGYGATVGGGTNNGAGNADGDRYAVIGGGYHNHITGGYDSTIGGGGNNQITADHSTIGGGMSNQSNSSYGTIGGGNSNVISSTYGTIPGGHQAQTIHYGEMAYASGAFDTAGDAQATTYVLRTAIAHGNGTYALYLDGDNETFTIPLHSAMFFDIQVIAIEELNDYAAGYHFSGAVKRTTSGTSFIGTPTKTVTEDSGIASDWDANITIDINTLVIQISDSSSSNSRWVATIRATEVGF